MKKITNFLRGTLRVQVSGADLERFLNFCAKEGIPIWDLDREERFLISFIVTRRDFVGLPALATRAQCSVEGAKRRGLPFFLARFRRRYALCIGLLFFCAALFIGSHTLMIIEVEGNERVTTAEILSALRQHGVHPGIYTPSVARGILANDILLHMDALSFFSINFYGTRAEVIVREKLPYPDILDETLLIDVTSAATGIIEHMEVLAGQARVQVGDTVCKGDLLIAGLVDIPVPEYAETDLGFYPTHAQGRIYARTWHTLRAALPLVAEVKALTGEETSRWALNIMGRRLNFYQNGGISFEKYDKITKSRTLCLPDGTRLPFSIERTLCRAYVTEHAALAELAAEEMLKAQLLADLQRLLPQEGDEVVTTDFVTRRADGVLEVTLLAECRQQIGREVPAAAPDDLAPTK